MVTTQSTTERFRTEVSNGRISIDADPPQDKGGGGAGFGAHELLEAAFAACMNMAVRICAVEHGIALEGVQTQVQLSRPTAGTVRFEYGLELRGQLSTQQRALLTEAAETCPVRQTLSMRLEFQSTGAAQSRVDRSAP